MKKAMIFYFFILAGTCYSQELKCNGHAEIQQVIQAEGKTAAELYKIAMKWVAKNFHNKDKVIQSTIENELIRGDGYQGKFIPIDGLGLVYSDLSYTFNIDLKDGRMRFTMNNMVSQASNSVPYGIEFYVCKKDNTEIKTSGQAQRIKSNLELYFKTLVDSFNKSLSEKGEDW